MFYNLKSILYFLDWILYVRKNDREGRIYFVLVLKIAMFKTADIISFFPRNLLDKTIKLYRGKNLYKTDSQNYRIKTNLYVRSS